jgi:hypothetical protein
MKTLSTLTLHLIFFSSIQLLTNASAATPQMFYPQQVKSYSHLGALSNPAYQPEQGLFVIKINEKGEEESDGKGVILHAEPKTNPQTRAFTMIAGRAVTSCASFDFAATVPSEFSITYRAHKTPAGEEYRAASNTTTAYEVDGCRGTYCGTGGEAEVFLSPDPALTAENTWKLLAVFPRQAWQVVMPLPRTIAIPSSMSGTVRSILVCRNGGTHEREDLEVDYVSLRADPTLPVATAPSGLSAYRAKFREYWNSANTVMETQGLVKDKVQADDIWNLFYPTPSVYSLLGGWIIEQDPTWKAAIERQITYSNLHRMKATPTVPGKLPFYDGPPPEGKPNTPFSRDAIAREAIAQYSVYEALNNPRYLESVDHIALGVFYDLIRASVTTVNPSTTPGPYNLYFGHYDLLTRVHFEEKEHISPNQNAEVGLLFTLLYHNPHSAFYLNSTARDIAQNELNAAISVQKANGALPLRDYTSAENNNNYDTNYASYTFALVAMANVYWNEGKYTTAIAKGGDWLTQYMSSDYPYWAAHFGNNETCVVLGCENSAEMWNRYIAYYQAGVDLNSYTNNLYSNWLKLSDAPFDQGKIVFLKAAGIPGEKYIPNTTKISISAFPATVSKGGTTYITWSTAGVQSCKIYSSFGPTFNEQVWDTALSGNNIASGGILNTHKLRLACVTSSGMTHEHTAQINVEPTISASPQIVPYGGTTYISWAAPGMKSCAIYTSFAPELTEHKWDPEAALSGNNVAYGGIKTTHKLRLECISSDNLIYEKTTSVTVGS